MRIGIFFQADDSGFAGHTLETLKHHGLPGTAYRLGPGWESLDGDEITFNFASVSHFIIIPQENSFRSRWLPFISGMGIGGLKTVCLMVPKSSIMVPRYLGTAHVFNDVDNLVEFLQEEADIWDKTFRIEKAREALIALGLGINEDNLAQRVASGDDESVANFLQIGYSPDAVNAQGVPLICLATRNGHKKTVDLLLDRGADVNVLSQDRGNSPLMEAAVRGDEHSVLRFLDAGADPNLVSKSGQTAVMLAIGEGHKDIVKLLLEYHADVDIKDSLGMTAYKYAQIFRHEEIVSLIEAYRPQVE